MNRVTFKEAKKVYESGNPVVFVDGNDLSYSTPTEAGTTVKPDGTAFVDKTKDWYMFNHWGNVRPELLFYVA